MPAKQRWAPRSRQRRAKSASPEKQCITQRSGAPSLVDDLEHLVVGVAVVDHQRLVEPLGEVDVPPERLDLRGPARPRRCGSGRGRSPPPPGPCRAPAPAPRSRPAPRRGCRPAASRGRLVGVQRDPGDQGVVGRRRLDRPPGARQVAADLHDPGDADAPRRPRARRRRRASRRRRRCRGGSGCRRPGAAAAPAPAGARGCGGHRSSPRWAPAGGWARRSARSPDRAIRARIASANASGAWVGIQWLTPSSTTSS